MKSKKNKLLNKEVRAINEELRLIWKQQQNLGYYKLEKPVRHGWFKELVITPNVERYKSEKAILEIYEQLENKYWGSSKDKATEKWQNQVSAYLIYKDLPTLSKKQFNKLSSKAQSMCVPYQFKNKNKKKKTRFYVKFPKATYSIKFRRAYITHRKRIDSALEKREAFLENKLKRQGYYEENEKEYGYKCLWSLKPRESRKQVKQELKQQVMSST